MLAVVVWIDPVYCPVHLPSEEFFRGIDLVCAIYAASSTGMPGFIQVRGRAAIHLLCIHISTDAFNPSDDALVAVLHKRSHFHLLPKHILESDCLDLVSNGWAFSGASISARHILCCFFDAVRTVRVSLSVPTLTYRGCRGWENQVALAVIIQPSQIRSFTDSAHLWRQK